MIARRPEHAHQGGLWEFPGGKLEPGESPTAALRREIDEELGVQVLAERPLIRLRHDYAERSVQLDVHRVTRMRGVPRGREGQPLRWVKPEALPSIAMPAADVPIVTAIRLPEFYPITPPHLTTCAGLLCWIQDQLEKGHALMQIRLPRFDDTLLKTSLERAADLAGDARLLVNSADSSLLEHGADGLHLAARHLDDPPTRLGWPSAASCHAPEELRAARRAGVDFAVLSPLLPTTSHPGARTLGWSRFSEWVDDCAMPVFALGGLSRGHLSEAWRHGAQGIAGIRLFEGGR